MLVSKWERQSYVSAMTSIKSIHFLTRNDVSKANGGHGDKAEVEGLDQTPVLEMREHVAADSKEEEEE